MKILIVSGFLGAGKTTFIQAMTDITGRDFAVYENEYAGAGIDTKRLEENPELSVWESTENCVCRREISAVTKRLISPLPTPVSKAETPAGLISFFPTALLN